MSLTMLPSSRAVRRGLRRPNTRAIGRLGNLNRGLIGPIVMSDRRQSHFGDAAAMNAKGQCRTL
jgi:hypothetical protein